MKKAILFCLVAVMLLCACGQNGEAPPPPTPISASTAEASTAPSGSSTGSLPENTEILVLDEPFLDAQYRDILTHPEDYEGKILQLEGMYNSWVDDYGGGLRHAIVRYCPDGCCGSGLTGLEIYYDGNCPEEEDWVRVTGTIEMVSLGKYPLPFPLLNVITFEVRNHDRGNETVPN